MIAYVYVHFNLDDHTFIFKKEGCNFAINALTTGTNTNVMPLLLMPPAKTWGIEVGSLCTPAHAFLDPAQGVLFEIWTTRIIRMVWTVIIEYSP